MVAGGRDGRRRHRGGDLPVRAPPGRRLDAGRPRRARRSARSPAAASRARSTSSRSPSSPTATPVLERYGVSDDDAFAVGLTCGGILDVYVEQVDPRDLPRARRDRRRHRGRPPGRAGHRHRAPRPGLARPPARRAPRRGRCRARLGSDAGRRRRPRRRARAARGRAQRDADLRPRRRAARRGHAGLRVGLRAQAADAGLRRHRLRRRGGPGRQRSSATT